MATPENINNLNYEEALTQYYRLKQRYDTSVEKIKDNVQKMKN